MNTSHDPNWQWERRPKLKGTCPDLTNSLFDTTVWACNHLKALHLTYTKRKWNSIKDNIINSHIWHKRWVYILYIKIIAFIFVSNPHNYLFFWEIWKHSGAATKKSWHDMTHHNCGETLLTWWLWHCKISLQRQHLILKSNSETFAANRGPV